jgi:poly[(R)-3-hydroxyalkanoate] polymerase subunit PhaC
MVTQAQLESARALGFEIRDPERFARNMARLLEETSKAVIAFTQPRISELKRASALDELAPVLKVFAQVQQAWLSQPHRLLKMQIELWYAYLDLWSSSIHRILITNEGEVIPTAAADREDARFRDPAWANHQYFDFMKSAYFVTSHWAERLIDEVEGIDPDIQRKARFYMRQIVNAIAPSNWIFTNPELLRETFASDGENLVRGMQFLAEDIRRGSGDLKIRQTDSTKFEVGKNLAITPGKIILQNPLMQLIQYEATTDEVLNRPLLIVPPWINKYYILDLNPEKSFVKWALDQGQTVFVISWVNPDKRLAEKSFEDYMREGIFAALDAIQEVTGEKAVNAVGYCVGGTLLAVSLGYMAAKRATRIKSATFLATQVDFRHAGDLKVFCDEDQILAIEREMAELGYLDSSKMATVFNLLRSNDLIWPYIVSVYIKGQEPMPFDVLFWNSDSTRLPAANHGFYLRHCYLRNDLSDGRMKIGHIKVDLSKVKIPIYSVAAREDHIAPPRSVFVGSRCFGGRIKFILAGSGHIAGVVNPPSRHGYQYWTGAAPKGELETWLQHAEEHPGSWWPDWRAWIESLDDKHVPARTIGGGKLSPIEDAPGSYAKMK